MVHLGITLCYSILEEYRLVKKALIALSLLLSSAICTVCSAKPDDHCGIIWYHEGGSELDAGELDKTIRVVLDTLPAGKISGMTSLISETLFVETRSGAFSYTKAAETWQNYGIAQIRADTARWFMDVLYKRDKRRFSEVYKYYDPESTLEHNLLVNVPFSIALCAELYAWRLKGAPIDTLHQRASAWKRYYNTSKGLGTVEGYKKRVLTGA